MGYKTLIDREMQIVKAYKLWDIIEDNWVDLSRLIKSCLTDMFSPYPVHQYDVCKTCREVLKLTVNGRSLSVDAMNSIKSAAYDNNMDLDAVSEILGILARNKYLKENKISLDGHYNKT